MNALPSVAVVILNWNGRHFLEKFLPSVLASDYGNLSVIVADNASTDDSVTFLKHNYPQIQLLLNKENEGFAKGYNTALKQVPADYYVLLNSDVEVDSGWITPVISLMEADETIAACQPKILSYQNRTDFEYAGACGGWLDVLGYPFNRGRVFDYIEKDSGQYNDSAQIFWATGAALFVKAKVFHALKGFDDYFFAHQEEIDLCWRMQRAGYKIFVEPASVVYHVGGGTLPMGNKKKTYLNFRNNLVMLAKNLSFAALIWKLPLRIGLDVIAALQALIKGNSTTFLAIASAHIAFVEWIFTGREERGLPKTGMKNLGGVYKKSIVWQYFINKKKTFSEIVNGKE